VSPALELFLYCDFYRVEAVSDRARQHARHVRTQVIEIGHLAKITSGLCGDRTCKYAPMSYRNRKWTGHCALALVLAFGLAGDGYTHNDKTERECEKTRQKIAKIESKMRAGYTASQGIKMDDELRRLRKLRAKQCR
jgi:hypothetical protein